MLSKMLLELLEVSCDCSHGLKGLRGEVGKIENEKIVSAWRLFCIRVHNLRVVFEQFEQLRSFVLGVRGYLSKSMYNTKGARLVSTHSHQQAALALADAPPAAAALALLDLELLARSIRCCIGGD